MTSFSQVVFNRIVEDTLNHITCGVLDIDTGYILVTGSRNEHLTRCFAFRYLDINGNCVWKKTYTDAINELWEGMDNIKADSGFPYFAGTKKNTITGETGIFINTFDNTFDLHTNFILFEDNSWKQALNQIYTDNFYYIVGQDYIEAEDRYSAMLVKANQNGNVVWRKSYGSIAEGSGSIFLNHENNLIIGGITGSFSPPLNNSKWYMIKTDTLGNLIWEKAFGHNSRNNGSVSGLIETQDSNNLACGSYPVANYGGTGEYLWDGCLRKIDQNGELIWEKFYRNYSCYPDGTGITISSSIGAIVQLSNNDLVFIGSSYWYYSRHRGFIIKTDSAGNIKWHKYYYADNYISTWQYFSSFQPTTDKGFIIAGHGDDYSNIGYDPPQQAWLVKTDSLGMDGLCNIEPDALNIDIDIPVLPEGFCMNDTLEVYVHIAGKSAPYTIEFSTGQVIDSIFYPPCFVPVEIGLTDINLTWAGETYFEESITEATLSNHEWGQCIIKPVEFYTPTTWGPQTLYITVTDAYGESKTITKEIFAVECSTYNDISDQSELKIYPNPVKDVLNIEVPRDCDFNNAEIYDSKGQIIIRSEFSGSIFSIDTRNIQPGTYVIKLSDSKGNIRSEYFEKIE